MRNITFRPMEVGDIPRIVEIERQVFTSPWSYTMFQSELTRPDVAKYIVAEAGNIVVAYGGMWLVINEAHITNIAVVPSMRRKGIGKDILYKLMEIAKDNECGALIDLEVRRSNFPAQLLYRNMGFRVIYVRHRYYEDNGEDAFIMAKY